MSRVFDIGVVGGSKIPFNPSCVFFVLVLLFVMGGRHGEGEGVAGLSEADGGADFEGALVGAWS